jgi:hypothetical protein
MRNAKKLHEIILNGSYNILAVNRKDTRLCHGSVCVVGMLFFT